ncbi:MAG TPA: hypothetical protein VJN88_10265 [Ktedonobacterales bacterium]|nr:hypothetical protein [Ktedonobacterales bacterium]
MGLCVGDLNPRQLDAFRVEVAETLADRLAYPPFFEYRSSQPLTRPLDRAKRDEIEQYVRSANFGPVDRSDITSSDLRRFLERLLVRYLEVNEVFQRPALARRIPQLRSQAPRLAAELQRGLVAYAQNNAPQFGAKRQRASWAAGAQGRTAPREGREHNTRVLEAVLAQQPSDVAPTQAPPEPKPAKPVSPARLAASWPTGSYDATVPVQSTPFAAAAGTSPFAGLETGKQSSVFGVKVPLSEMSTGPLTPAQANGGHNGATTASDAGAHGPRELPPDLYQLYGEYLRDMEPEADSAYAAPAVMDAPTAALPVAPPARNFPDASTYAPSYPNMARPVPAPAHADSGEHHGDKLIFFQLRYQLEAYVRRAARSYGVVSNSGDPSGVLDALRRSGFVDEADLRIAEGILALTDRVTATGVASTEDYRQALMLYLLYHRSHLG